MADNQQININKSQIGMNLNARDGELTPQSYRLLVNGNIQSKSGDLVYIVNEYSNILCSKFKPGFKVINVTPVLSLGKILFFLVNPSTGESEFGEIGNITYTDVEDRQYSCTECNTTSLEDAPLEQILQIENCIYSTIVNASCLQFSINHPIQSWVKIDDCNIRIYFTDNTDTGLRYIDYDYQKKDISNCPLVSTQELDCDKIKVFKDTCYPKIESTAVRAGGENKAGTYQFAISYSDPLGNPIGNYFFVSNPIPLFELPITVSTDYITNQSIVLKITDLSQEFKYFNLAVIKTINNVSSAYLVDTLSVTTQEITYTYTGSDKNLLENLSLDQIFARHPYYKKAELITESNGYVLWGNLEQDRVWNLQPVINDLRLKWQTVELDEGDYRNPIFHSKYRSNLRDEVYPYAIELVKTNGQVTARFHIPAPSSSEVPGCLDIIPPTNPDNFIQDNCDTPSEQYKWKVYNTTPSPEGYACGYTPPSQETVHVIDYVTCLSYQYGGNIKYQGNPIPNPSGQCWTTPAFESKCIDSLKPNYPPSATFVLETVTERIVTPETSYKQCVYPTDISTPEPTKPPYTRVLPGDSTPNAWLVPTNITCGSATILVPKIDDTCSRTSGLFIYGYLSYVATPSSAVTTPCGSGYDDNAVWYSFTASNYYHAISLGSPVTDLVIQVFEEDCTTPVPPSYGNCTYNYFVNSSTSPLIPGNTYKVKIFNLDPSSLTTDVGSYFDICINTPSSPTSCVDAIIPAVKVLECKYKIEYDEQKIINHNCVAAPYKKGSFGYWESQELYPCNEEVWGSLANTPIRHYKFPDFNISPFFENVDTITSPSSPESFKIKNKIYPIGVVLDVNDLKTVLNNAVTKGLISEEEKLSICGYRILRGSRNGNQSIIAKGLLYDVWNYTDTTSVNSTVLYPNYPYNDLNTDIFLASKPLKNRLDAEQASYHYNTPFSQLHPYSNQDYKNNKYTFHSPNIHFNNPSLGTELKLECEQFGWSFGSYNKVKRHAEYQYTGTGLSGAAIGFATTETSIEAINSLLQSNVSISISVLGTGTSIPLGYILSAIALNLAAPSQIINHYYEWLDLLQKFAPYRNYAYYFSSIGRYVNHATPLNYNVSNTRRRLLNKAYLKNGIFSVQDGDKIVQFNNARRESSAYLNIDNFFTTLQNKDYSRWAPGLWDYQTGGTITCDSTQNYKPISSYYASIKNYNPSQYGNINHIDYIDTGYDGKINWFDDNQNTLCDTIFGGDTFINRFSIKRKHPFFIEERVSSGLQGNIYPDNSDVLYSELYNVAYPKFFFNYPTGADSDDASGTSIFANVAVKSKNRLDYNFACEGYTGKSLPATAITLGALSSSGAGAAGVIAIPITFGVLEGLNFQGQKAGDTPVYLNGKIFLYSYGIPSFLVESDYNLEYRYGENYLEKAFYPYVGDIQQWTQESIVPIFEDNYYFYNTTYTKQNKENFGYTLNPNYSREKDDCKVVNSNRVIYSLQDSDNNDSFDGNLIYPANNYYDFPKSGGKLKQVRGVNNNAILILQEDQASVYNSYVELQTNKGTTFVGTGHIFSQQPHQYIKTDLGFAGTQHQAYVSSEFGHFYVDAKRGAIIKYQPGSGTDFSQVGSETCSNWLQENLPFKILRDFLDVNIDNPFKYFGISLLWDQRFKRLFVTKRDHQLKKEYKGKVTFNSTTQEFYLNSEHILPTDTRYFINKCWTLSYSPITNSIISFYTFYPNYYAPSLTYFSSGVNYNPDTLHEEGIWSHLLTSKSFQVFYGHLHPFMFEYQEENKISNKVLQSISYNADTRRYTSEYDYYKVNNKTFNKALIYNQNQSTGILNLHLKEKNNLFQSSQYPKVTLTDKTILVENVENNYNFNQFSDLSQNNNQPLLHYFTNPMYKEVNPLSLSYAPKYLSSSLRSDYFNIRLENDKYSNYMFVLKYQWESTVNNS